MTVSSHIEAGFKLKKDLVATPTDFLGATLKERPVPLDNSKQGWSFDGTKYITNAIANLEENIKKKGLPPLPKKALTPFPSGYRPEIDTTDELNDEDTGWYQELIGILRWAVELGRIDIQYEVTALSSHIALPRQGHLKVAMYIFAYLKRAPNRWILMDPRYPSPFQGTEPPIYSDWDHLYPDAAEQLPPEIPKPRGKHVEITCFVDADHAANRVTRRSHTGILIFVNMAPVIWYSKRQNTVESSSFGSEFIAMRIAVDQIEALRYKLRMFGVPLGTFPDLTALPATIYCDNQSVVTNSSDALSKLNKKHNSIAFHRVREACAGGWISVRKIDTGTNWADLLTKALSADVRMKHIDSFMY